MIDLVPNHTAVNAIDPWRIDSGPKGLPGAYDIFTPDGYLRTDDHVTFNRKEDYHWPPCRMVFDVETDKEMHICSREDQSLITLDLNTENPSVVKRLHDYAAFVVGKGFDGIRVDAARSLPISFVASFCQASGVFCNSEAFSRNMMQNCNYQIPGHGFGNFAGMYNLTFGFGDGWDFDHGKKIGLRPSLAPLKDTMRQMNAHCGDLSLISNFMDNQDISRIASYQKDPVLIKNALTFIFQAQGIPTVYYGTEQSYGGGYNPFNRESLWHSGFPTTSYRYQWMVKLNHHRKIIIKEYPDYLTAKAQIIDTSDDVLVFVRGPVLTMVNILGLNSPPRRVVVKVPYEPGTVLYEVWTDKEYTVSQTGTLAFDIVTGHPRIWYPVLDCDC